jgi:2-C-methyl-D-erythritol 2,4-cyclodiphosphate synthase
VFLYSELPLSQIQILKNPDVSAKSAFLYSAPHTVSKYLFLNFLRILKLLLQKIKMGIRIGFGVDFHQLAEGRPLMIGGVEIPHHKGSVGHSDADVLLHAICDAALGAAALGDIGVHFPDTDNRYKNIDSLILLQRTMELVKREGYRVVNIDSTLCLEEPKIKPYVPQMQQAIASIVGLGTKDISIKATTTEKMGFVGREEGLVAYATILLETI